MSTFLLELLSEEVPARMQEGARIQIRDLFIEKLQAQGVTAEEITVFNSEAFGPSGLWIAYNSTQYGEEIKGPQDSC